MRPFPPARRRLVTALVAAAAGLGVLPAASADAAAPRPVPITASQPVPTAAAESAGVQAGGARMGWKQDRTGATADASARAAAPAPFVPSGVLGIDVSSWQGNLDWTAQAALGKKFAYVKATEGTGYRNPYFRAQYTGAYRAGLIRGAYHFALPSASGGRTQAASFVRNGGGWSADGHTLPGVLDIEYNPYGPTCYGKTQKQMVRWVNAFVTEYKRLTTRDAVIYTTAEWWKRCTGDSRRFSTTNPLWLARYGVTTPGTLPGGWKWATFWQYSNNPVDQNRFSASYARLVVLARRAS